MRIAEETKQAVRLRFGFRCGYCGVSETSSGAALTIDHFQPRSGGGSDDIENLVYCCHACNQFKADYWQPDLIEHVLPAAANNRQSRKSEGSRTKCGARLSSWNGKFKR